MKSEQNIPLVETPTLKAIADLRNSIMELSKRAGLFKLRQRFER